jgi:hypothetical protein
MEAAEQETLDTALVRVSQRALQPQLSAAAQLRMALQRPRNCGPNAAALLCAREGRRGQRDGGGGADRR